MDHNRRRFLQYVLGTTAAVPFSTLGQDALLYRSIEEVLDQYPELPKTLSAVSGIPDLEKLAELALPSGHFGYIYSGAGDGSSLYANLDAYKKYDIYPRRLQGLGKADTSTSIFGEKWRSPIFLSPTNGHRAFHPEGEIASGRGASAADTVQILSSLTTTPVEQVNEAKSDRPVWFQLYPTNSEKIRYELVKRAEDAGCPAIVVTVDDIGGRGSEVSAKYYNSDTRDCRICHQRENGISDFLNRKSMFQKYKDLEGFGIADAALSFDDIRRLRDNVKGRLIVKGIMHPQDAMDCVQAGVDGIVVSNHGGRIDSGGVGTLDALPAIVSEIKDKATIFIDGGIRRGTDVFKALALGADAVGFGRPYLYGLASYGAEGVTLSIDIIHRDLVRSMIQSGIDEISEIRRNQLLDNV